MRDLVIIILCHVKDKPRWFMVDVKFVRKTKRYIPLHELRSLHLKHKASGGPLARLGLFTTGGRLSVMGITEQEWDFILTLEDKKEND